MNVCHMHSWCLGKPEEGVSSPGARVTGYELSDGGWHPNLGRLEEPYTQLLGHLSSSICFYIFRMKKMGLRRWFCGKRFLPLSLTT